MIINFFSYLKFCFNSFWRENKCSSIQIYQPTTHYKFEVFAWTRVGRGPAKVATIQSGVEPVLPHPPTKLAVTNIEAFSVVLQFTPKFDGNSSIVKWVVEVYYFS